MSQQGSVAMNLRSLPTDQELQAIALIVLMTVIGALGMAAVLGLLRRRTQHLGLRALMSLVEAPLFLSISVREHSLRPA